MIGAAPFLEHLEIASSDHLFKSFDWRQLEKPPDGQQVGQKASLAALVTFCSDPLSCSSGEHRVLLGGN